MNARLGRRHPDYAEERTQVDGAAVIVRPRARLGVELPVEAPLLAAREAETVVEESWPASGDGEAPGPDPYLVDPDGERATSLGAAHLYRAEERVPAVKLGVARVELLALPDVPARAEGREADRISGVDGENRLEVAGEMPVQRAALERELVDQNSSSLRAAAVTRSTDGMYESSIFQ